MLVLEQVCHSGNPKTSNKILAHVISLLQAGWPSFSVALLSNYAFQGHPVGTAKPGGSILEDSTGNNCQFHPVPLSKTVTWP